MKKILSALWIILLISLIVANFAEAKSTEKISVIWSADVLSMNDSADSLLNCKDFSGKFIARDRIAEALTQKLHQLARDGNLPFELQESMSDYSLHAISGDDPIGLIPMATLDTSFDTSYVASGKTYYRSLIFCGLSIAICAADPLNNSWKILATIPLNGYDFIGDDINNPRTQPISQQEKAECFARIAVSMIRNDLDFSQYKDRKLFRDLDLKSLGGEKFQTYQVTDVKLSSKKAQEVFRGREDEIKNIVAAFYTSNYQRRTRNIVYPPVTGAGSRWKQNVSQNLYTYQMQTPNGTINFSFESPDQKIQLDIYGLNSGEIDTEKRSEVKRDIIYKAWIRKFPEEKVSDLSDSTRRREIITDNASINYDPADVYTILLINIAGNLGSGKSK